LAAASPDVVAIDLGMPMFRLPHQLAHFLRTHHGVVVQRDLDRLGVPALRIRRLVRANVLERIGREAWRLTATPRTFEHRVAAACAVHPNAAAAFTTAGRLWNLRGMGPEAVHVIIRGDARPVPIVGVVHHCYHVDECDVIDRGDGIRVTTPSRTAFDLARVLTDNQLESVFEQLIDQRMCTIETLAETGRRLRQRGRTGSARFGRVLESRPVGLKPVGSDLELRLERAIRSAGLPRPVRQHEFELPSGRSARADFYWPEQRLVVEVDHITWHGGRAAANADKGRDRWFACLGIRTLRVTNDDIADRLPTVVDDIARVLALAA
jgi:very-short-patch-repair endonuclease